MSDPGPTSRRRPVLLVVSGRPGTGKTTLAGSFAAARRACYLRVDAVETALARTGLAVGVGGYVVVHEVAVANLALGLDVVVDAVNPVPEARAGWREAADRSGSRLVQVETRLANAGEHRRRVEAREPDLPGQRVPTWDEVQTADWTPWDEQRDGSRVVVDTNDAAQALATLLAAPDLR